jgi:hypothetical protein
MIVSILFFRGKGVIPFIIRLCSMRKELHFSRTPAHCAIVLRENYDDLTGVEYESIVTGVTSHSIDVYKGGTFLLNGLIDVISYTVPDECYDKCQSYLELMVGKPYGFSNVILTGIGQLPGNPHALFVNIWEKLRSGRTSPRDCSELVRQALCEANIAVIERKDKLPLSPTDLYLSLKIGK